MDCARETVLTGVAVPCSMLRAPDAFGGVLAGDCRVGDLVFRQGHTAGMCQTDAQPTRLVLPRLTEPHVHLDKCHTVDRMADVGGNLAAALNAQSADKAHWTVADLRTRVGRGIAELLDAGCGAVRTHVDWGQGGDAENPPLAWDILKEWRADLQPGKTLQLAALTSAADLADPARAALIARHIARDQGVLGCFILDHGALRAPAIHAAFALAEQHGLALDFHVDEGLGPDLDGLSIIADTALETGFAGPVLCGHACSLMNISGDPLRRLADKLARADIAVAVLPSTNLYLQGRRAGTPDRRGLTRVHELIQAGVSVVTGTDNVRDAFCPLGRHDPVQSLMLTVLAGHLDPPFGRHLPMITTAASTALGLAPIHVDSAVADDLILFEAGNLSLALTGALRPRPVTEALKDICT